MIPTAPTGARLFGCERCCSCRPTRVRQDSTRTYRIVNASGALLYDMFVTLNERPYLDSRGGLSQRARNPAVYAENVLIYHSRERQPVKHCVARLPHFFPERLAESVLIRLGGHDGKGNIRGVKKSYPLCTRDAAPPKGMQHWCWKTGPAKSKN